MQRFVETEILEQEGVPEEQVARAYRQLTRIHRYLGDTRAILNAIRDDPFPVRRVLDIGCGHGGVLNEIRGKLGVHAIGVDLKPPLEQPFPIEAADAVTDRLPAADVAFSMYLAHHLGERDLLRLISNVGRSCRRFLLLDLVRHPLPLALFKLFLAPIVCGIVSTDGQRSIRRSYTSAELSCVTQAALAGTGAQFRHSTSPLYIRQILDISYGS